MGKVTMGSNNRCAFIKALPQTDDDLGKWNLRQDEYYALCKEKSFVVSESTRNHFKQLVPELKDYAVLVADQ